MKWLNSSKLKVVNQEKKKYYLTNLAHPDNLSNYQSISWYCKLLSLAELCLPEAPFPSSTITKQQKSAMICEKLEKQYEKKVSAHIYATKKGIRAKRPENWRKASKNFANFTGEYFIDSLNPLTIYIINEIGNI